MAGERRTPPPRALPSYDPHAHTLPEGPTPLSMSWEPEPEPPATPSSIPAEQTGRYRPVAGEAPIGRGGIGVVTAVWDEVLGREVARKSLVASGGRPEVAERFVREARATARLQHPGVVPIYDLGRRKDGTPYYTMKYVHGQTLAAAVQARRALPERLGLLSAFVDVCQAVAYAHSQGVIHRDLKPANVMVGEFGETVVLDWGLARIADEPGHPPLALPEGVMQEDGPLTLVGAVLGTPAYMPPEQASGDPAAVSEAADIYALGAMLYEILAGHPPFRQKDPREVLDALAAGGPPPLREVCPQAPPELAAVVARAMARAPGDRYPSAGALAAEVEAFRANAPVSAYRYSALERLRLLAARNRRPFAVGVVGVLALLALGAISTARILAERDRARAAEEAAEARAVEALENLADALAEKAASTPEIDPFTATLHAAGALALGERPEARGVLARAARQWAPTLRGHLAIPGGCRGLAWQGEALLCAREGAIERWEGGVRRYALALEARLGSSQIAQSPDQRLLALALNGPQVLVIDAARGEPRARIDAPGGGAIRSLVFSADGQQVIAAHTGGEQGPSVVAWDATSGRREAGVKNQLFAEALARAPDGGVWAALRGLPGRTTNGVALLDPESLDAVAWHEATNSPFNLAWSPDGRWLSAAQGDGTVNVWDALDMGAAPRVLHGLGLIGHDRWSMDGALLIDQRESGEVTFWRSRTWSPLYRTTLPPLAWRALAVASDGRRFAAATTDGVAIWDLGELQSGEWLGDPGAAGGAPKLPADGRFVLTSRLDALELWSPGGALLRRIPAPAGRVEPRLSPDGRLAVKGGEDGATLIDLEAGVALRRVGEGPIGAAAFADQGRTLLLLEADGTLGGWDPASAAPRWRGRDGAGYDYLFAGDEPRAMVFSRDRGVLLVDARDGSTLQLHDGEGVYYGELSRNGRWAALTLQGGEVLVYDTREAAPVARLRPWEGANPRVMVSDDGRLLAAGGSDSAIRLWDLREDRLIALLRGHRQRLQSLAFSPDGALLVSETWGQEIRTWDLGDLWAPGDELRARAEARSARRLQGVRVVDAPP